MQRIDDHARQPRRIEQALFQIELPGAALLREQKPLQAVGEPSDHALQVRELLVEIAAQPVEFLGIAEIFRADDLVEFGRKGLVVGTARLVAIVPRPPRLGGGFRIAHFGVVGHVGGRRVDGFSRAFRHVLGRGFGLFQAHALAVGGFGRFAVGAGFVAAAFLVTLVALLLVGVAVAILAHVEGIEQVVHHVAEAALIGEHAFEPVEIAAGALLDDRAPQIHELARGRRRLLAGEPLAHDHGDGVLDRRVGAVGDVVVFSAMEAVVEHGGEIGLHAAHAARADRLDARLLDRIEHRARLLAARRELAMHRRIVTGEPQRDRIGVTAHDRGLALGEPARRLRQPRLVGGKAGTLGGKADLDIAPAGNRAQANADRALERLGRRFLGRIFCLDVRGHRCLPRPACRERVGMRGR